MLGLKHKYADGIFYLSGSIDEHCSLEAYNNALEPIVRWNLRGVVQINSLGIRMMMKFIRDLGARPIEFYDCPPAFLEAANIIPGIVGGSENAHRVKSIYLPMRCEDAHLFNASVPVKDISFSPDISMPIFDCPTCTMPLQPDVEIEIEDLLFFLNEES